MLGLIHENSLDRRSAAELYQARAIEPHFSCGQLQFLESWNQDYPELVDQLVHFPLDAYDDGAQCARRCTDAHTVHGRASPARSS